MTRKLFFEKHINNIKQNKICCANCGVDLIGYTDNIAHIIKKSSNKEIEFEDDCIIYLCGRFEGINCHSKN